MFSSVSFFLDAALRVALIGNLDLFDEYFIVTGVFLVDDCTFVIELRPFSFNTVLGNVLNIETDD